MSRYIRPHLKRQYSIPLSGGWRGLFWCYRRGIFRHFTWPITDIPRLLTATLNWISKKPQNLLQYAAHVSGLPYWYGQFKALILLSLARAEPYHFIRGDKRNVIIREARIYLALYVLVLIVGVITDSIFLLWYWLVPMLVGQPFLRNFLLAEHTLCPEVADMFENTRTTRSNKVIQWLCWNMCYHVEHHAYPAVPFHQLAKVHSMVRPHIKVLDSGYIAVNRKILQSVSGAVS